MLFIDARKIFRQIDRAHREFTPEQIEFLANIVRLYRGEPVETPRVSEADPTSTFPAGVRRCAGPVQGGDARRHRGAGLEPQPRPLRRRRAEGGDDFDFAERLEELHEELETLNADAHDSRSRSARTCCGYWRMAMDDILRSKREAILAVVRAHGADNVRLFGSTVRGERRTESGHRYTGDPRPGWTLMDRIRLKQALEDLLGAEVDLVTDSTLHPRLREHILEEAAPL